MFASRKGMGKNKGGMRELKRDKGMVGSGCGKIEVDRYTKRYYIFTIDDDNRMNMRRATLIHMAR